MRNKKIGFMQNIASILVKADFELVFTSSEARRNSQNSINLLLATCKFLTSNLR